MALELVGSGETPPQPRCVVVRMVSDLPAVLAIANADVPVPVVLRVESRDRQRIVDILTGWAIGASGTLDWLGTNTVALRSPRAPTLRLISHGIAAAAERLLTAEPDVLTRDGEIRLRRQAAAGSVDARRRLIDSYAEIATLVALWLRPPHTSTTSATRRAHRELDRLVEHESSTPLLVELVNRIATRPTSSND